MTSTDAPFWTHFASPWHRNYARSKLASDPVYSAVLEVFRKERRPLIDLGCGIGLLAFYLRSHGVVRAVTGIDTDTPKVATARVVAEACGWSDLRFESGDALEALGRLRGDVAMLDLLHYFDDAGQTELLRKAAGAARGGVIVIRECIAEPGNWRYVATVLEERFARAVRWLNVARLNFPTRERIVETLEAEGFAVEMIPMWGRTPFNNYLVVGRDVER